ncbi:MAG TPA: glycerol kinase GlpK [Alphaproteobacteria bacterium]|nr:glycerol kinase GlpK [Alphaproteobacteria bacterium]
MPDYLLAIDQGTTSTRSILFDRGFRPVATAQRELPQHFPQDGWVEHAPADILEAVIGTARDAIGKAGLSAQDLAGIGIANQRETTIVWDRSTGEPIYPAVVWQDRRTSDVCRRLLADDAGPLIAAKTGLLIDPYFSATKIAWILDHVPGARVQAGRGELAFGTVDCFLLWHLTGRRAHLTDATNAARTMLFDIHRQCWDDELLSLFNVPREVLPQVRDTSDEFGATDMLGSSVPILGMVGDQQGALIGQGCVERGMAKSTYGTGCFLVLNTGDQALSSGHKLLTTIGYRIDGKATYALEGSIFVAGAVVQWMRDGLKLISDAGSSEAVAASIGHDHGVYFVPAFTGLGAPYWDPEARGAILGLTRDTGIAEIVSAGLQAVCFQTRDLQQAMALDGLRPDRLRVDGGMAANGWVMQFLADLLGVTVERPVVTETTALGAAYLAGLGAGFIGSIVDTKDLWQSDRTFSPVMGDADRDRLYAGWQRAVARITG